MCQPQSKGGKRCPNHQPGTVGTSRFITENYGLTKDQVKGTFHQLRAQGQGMPNPTMEEYQHFRNKQLRIISRSKLDDETKAKIRTQLNRRLEEHQLPDGATFYAQKKLLARSREQKKEFVGLIRDIAQAQNTNRNEARRLFDERYEQLSAISGVTNPGDKFDRRTLAAAATLTSRNARTGQRLTSETPRIQRQDVSDRSLWVKEIGYDPDDGRLEMTVDGTDKVYSYHKVPRRLAQKLMSQEGEEFSRTLRNEIMFNPSYQYNSQEEAERDSSGRWCYECHSYRAASGHTCIPRSLRQGRPAEEETESVTTSSVEQESVEETNQEKKDKYAEALAKVQEQARIKAEQVNAVPDEWKVPYDEREQVEANLAWAGQEVLEEYKDALYLQGKTLTSPSPMNVYDADNDKLAYSDKQQYGFSKTATTYAYVNEEGRLIVETKVSPEDEQRAKDYGLRIDVAETSNAASIVGYLAPEEAFHYVKDNELDLTGRPQTSSTQIVGNQWVRMRTPTATTLHAAFSAMEKNPETVVILGDLDTDTPFPGFNDDDYYQDEPPYDESDMRMFTAPDGSIAFGSGPELKCWRTGCNEKAPCPVHTQDNKIFTSHFVQSAGDRPMMAYNPLEDSPQMATGAKRLEMIEGIEKKNWRNNEEESKRYAEAAKNREVLDGYVADVDQYVADVREAQARQKRGENPIPFTEGPVTNGIASRESGRGFGIELEFVLPDDVEPAMVNDEIAQALYDAGLSDEEYATEYHGYSGDMWHIEEDYTVAGEVVSPILYDDEESWKQVKTVCDIIKAHGGKASVSVGGHVHMGIDPNVDPKKAKASLATVVAANQDAIQRLQTNPDRKTHRPVTWCRPEDKDSVADRIYEFTNNEWYEPENDHNNALNYAYDNRVEFRGGDGSLDPGHIQAQVMMSAALMKRAEERSALSNPVYSSIGSNSRRSIGLGISQKDKSDDEIIVEDHDMRRSLDDIFDTPYERKVMASIAAIVPWQAKAGQR